MLFCRQNSQRRELLDQLEDEKIAKGEEILKYLTSVMRGQPEAYEVVVEGKGEVDLSKQQRQKILGVRNNQQYEQGGDWQKLLPNWQGLGKQGSRLGELKP